MLSHLLSKAMILSIGSEIIFSSFSILNSLSVSLSRGAVAEIEDERARIIGLDKDGFLCVEVDGREVLVSDAHAIKWNYP